MFNLGTGTPRLTGALALYLAPFAAVGLLLLTDPGSMDPANRVGALLLLALTPVAVGEVARGQVSRRERATWLVAGLSITGWLWALAALWLVPASRDLLTVALLLVLFGTPGLPEPVRRRTLGLAGLAYLFSIALGYLLSYHTFEPRAELMRAFVVGLALITAALLGRAYTCLEERLAAQQNALQRAAFRLTWLRQRDSVTRTYNRRFLFELLGREKARADRLRRSFSVVLLAVDYFQRVSDQYGHGSADQLLRAFAQRLKSHLRGSDLFAPGRVLGRFDAEQFLLVLPETDLSSAQSAVDRLRAQIAVRPFAAGIKLTVSAGIAEYRLGETLENPLKRAQRALHLAQQWGRNRVEVDPEGSHQVPLPAVVVSLADHRARNA